MLVSVGGRARAHLSIGDQSFHIAKIFDAKLSIFDGKKREGKREREEGTERKIGWISRSVMA